MLTFFVALTLSFFSVFPAHTQPPQLMRKVQINARGKLGSITKRLMRSKQRRKRNITQSASGGALGHVSEGLMRNKRKRTEALLSASGAPDELGGGNESGSTVEIGGEGDDEGLTSITEIGAARGERGEENEGEGAKHAVKVLNVGDKERANQWRQGLTKEKMGIITLFVLFCFLLICYWQCVCGGRPFGIAPCLPHFLRMLIPSAFREIQDFDHLVLMVCFFVGIGMGAYDIYEITHTGCAESTCTNELLGCCYLLPSICYVYLCIGSYDSRLCSRRQQAADQKKHIIEVHMAMLDETEKSLEAATDSNAGLAERGFESRKRDFSRFLGWVSALDDDQAQTLENGLRRYMEHWLHVFEETSLDPVRHPRRGDNESSDGPLPNLVDCAPDGLKSYMLHCVQVFEEETSLDPVRHRPFLNLLRCKPDVRNAAKDLQDRLKVENVHFIALEKERVQERRNDLSSIILNAELPMTLQRVRSRFAFPSWVAAGHGECGLETLGIEPDSDGFPFRFMCCCCDLTVMTRGHLLLLFWILFGAALIVMTWCNVVVAVKTGGSEEVDSMLVGLIMFEVCLFLILWNYERIDNMMRVEREIQDLEAARKQAAEQKARVGEFFGMHQVVVDMWLYRTIPLFELLHEVEERLRDYVNTESLGKIPQLLDRACGIVDEMLRRAGSAQDWLVALEHIERERMEDVEGKRMGAAHDAGSPKLTSPRAWMGKRSASVGPSQEKLTLGRSSTRPLLGHGPSQEKLTVGRSLSRPLLGHGGERARSASAQVDVGRTASIPSCKKSSVMTQGDQTVGNTPSIATATSVRRPRLRKTQSERPARSDSERPEKSNGNQREGSPTRKNPGHDEDGCPPEMLFAEWVKKVCGCMHVSKKMKKGTTRGDLVALLAGIQYQLPQLQLDFIHLQSGGVVV